MSSGENAMKRAEQVRARRVQRREGRPILGRSPVSKAPAIPRMVARNPEAERRIQAHSSTEARRRHYLKLADMGAELRLPSLPSVHIGWRFISGIIVALTTVMMYAMAASPSFTVSRVELRGAERLDPNAVNAALQVAGETIFSVQPDKLLTILTDQFPELDTVKVSVGLPARVVVRVTERLPVLVWEQAGLTLWVDAAGVAFIPQDAGTDLIRVAALEAPPALSEGLYTQHQLIRPEMVTAIQALARIAPQGAPLIYDPKLGVGWEDPGGWQAFFGQDGRNIDQRLAVYLSILNELAARRLTPTLISVAQLHAPYYRMDY
jgi:hypothetical protein